jgi:hypothetical protein
MRDRWVIVAVLATLVAVAGAAAHADSRAERFDLGSNVPALAASAAIAGSSLTVTVDGARAGARVDAAVARLACTFLRRAAGGTLDGGLVGPGALERRGAHHRQGPGRPARARRLERDADGGVRRDPLRRRSARRPAVGDSVIHAALRRLTRAVRP